MRIIRWRHCKPPRESIASRLRPRAGQKVLSLRTLPNGLVGGITALALVMLFWPLLSKVLTRLRGD